MLRGFKPLQITAPGAQESLLRRFRRPQTPQDGCPSLGGLSLQRFQSVGNQNEERYTGVPAISKVLELNAPKLPGSFETLVIRLRGFKAL